MNTQSVTIPEADLRRLLASGSADAAMLYLYIHSGNEAAGAEKQLRFSQTRLSCAEATLRQLGLWPQEAKPIIAPGERPSYSETDVLRALDSDGDFKLLYGEVQRLLGRSLNTEELKILLGFVRYLGLPGEVISVLVSYCKDRARQKGSLRNPSLRTIEKEAYRWAEEGIDTLEAAGAYIHAENQKNSRLHQLTQLLQIRGRTLTAAEARYAQSWLDMGFPDEVITLAYEKTCLNTGSLSWPYMNKILTSWHKEGLKTADQVRTGGHSVPKGASGQLGQAELEAIQRILKED